MSHDMNIIRTGSEAAQRICLLDQASVLAWCADIHCTEQELRAAVYAVGSEPHVVRGHLLTRRS